MNVYQGNIMNTYTVLIHSTQEDIHSISTGTYTQYSGGKNAISDYSRMLFQIIKKKIINIGLKMLCSSYG